MRNPPLEHDYAANVALVVLALFPGLINTSAIGLLGPVIGADLGVSPDAVGRLPLFNDAALAFGRSWRLTWCASSTTAACSTCCSASRSQRR